MSSSYMMLLAAFVMSAISFVLVGVSPRSVGRARAEALLRVAAPIARFVRVLLGPLAGLLAALGNRVTPGRSRLGAVATERELLSVVDEATERDVLEEEDRQLIHSILEFDDTVARSVMVPRTDMVTVDAEASLVEALELFLSSGHSRIPVVVDDDVDNIDRVLYLRDVARQQAAGALKSKLAGEIARPASLVPESIKLNSLLRLMQAESTHMALIVDEYGGIAGLVTLEDLIEELVGDISDEYDRDAPEVVELPNENYRVSARLAIDELGDLYGLELDDDDVDTVGGLLTKALGRLPRTGDQAEFAGVRLRADRVQGRRRQLVTVIAEPTDALRELMATRADRESGESE